MRETGEASAAYRPDIDGLRAIAVLSVVNYHAGFNGFSGGFVGVDIFFVISGYLISGIIWRDIHNRCFSLTEFYVRRVRRIFPALFVVLACSTIAAYFLLIPADLVEFGKSLKATVLFYSNFQSLKVVGYFDGPAIDKPLLHTWSLSVEEQFYAIWPLLLLLMARFLPAKRVLPVLLAIAGISLLLAELKLDFHPKDSFYVSYYRMWELALGAALAISQPLLLSRRVAASLTAAGLLAIAYAVAAYDATTPFPGLTALLPCVGAALIIAGGGAANPISRMLSFPPFRLVGLISYSLYLIHWPLFSFAHLYVYDTLSFGLRLSIVIASLLLAYLSWRFVETPFRRKSSGNRVALVRGAAFAGAFPLLGILFVSFAGFPFRVDDSVLAAQDVERTSGELAVISQCRLLPVEGWERGKECVLGEPRAEGYDFLIWGDSHAARYIPAIAMLARQNHASGVVLTKGGCPPFLDDAVIPRPCRALNKAIADWIALQKSLRFVFLASRWDVHRREIDRAVNQEGGEDAEALAQTLALLKRRNVTAVVLGQVPDYTVSVPLCAAHARFHKRDETRCVTQSAASVKKRFQFVEDYFQRLRRRYDFALFDPLSAFCDAERCSAMSNGAFLMADSNHLTEAGSYRLLPYLNIPGLPYHLASEALAVSETGMPRSPSVGSN